MSKRTSAHKARKESQLKKFRAEDIQSASVRQSARDQELVDNRSTWQNTFWAQGLDSFENPSMMVMRMLDDGKPIEPGTYIRSMYNLLPRLFSRYNTSMSEIIAQGREYWGEGVVLDEETLYNAIVVRFLKKLRDKVPVLYIGINTDEPEEIYGYDGPAPRYATPEEEANHSWKLTPEYACLIFKIPTVYVPKKEYSNEGERVRKLIAAHHVMYKKMLLYAAKDEILVLKRKFSERGIGEAVDNIDVAEQLQQIESDDKYVAAGYLGHMKTPGLGLHPMHDNSSPTIEAEAIALANVMMEELVGRMYFGAPELGTDGVYRKRLLVEELGLIGDLGEMGDDMRKHVRLIAFLHKMGSLNYLSQEKMGRDGQMYRTYKRMSPQMIMDEWSANTEIDQLRFVKTIDNSKGEPTPTEVTVIPAHTREITLTPSKATIEAGRLWIDECIECENSGQESMHKTTFMGRTTRINVPKQVYDIDSRHYVDPDEESVTKTRQIVNRTEILSQEEGLTKRKMARAVDAFYSLLQLARQHLLESEGMIEGPRMANGQFYSKLHPTESGRDTTFIKVDAEGARHPVQDSFGYYEDLDWAAHSSHPESALVKATSDTQFGDGPAGNPMKYGDFSHFWDSPSGERRSMTLRGVIQHEPHEGCICDDTITVRRVAPTYTASELEDFQGVTPLVEKAPPTSEKDKFNEALTSILTDIQLGEL